MFREMIKRVWGDDVPYYDTMFQSANPEQIAQHIRSGESVTFGLTHKGVRMTITADRDPEGPKPELPKNAGKRFLSLEDDEVSSVEVANAKLFETPSAECAHTVRLYFQVDKETMLYVSREHEDRRFDSKSYIGRRMFIKKKPTGGYKFVRWVNEEKGEDIAAGRVPPAQKQVIISDVVYRKNADGSRGKCIGIKAEGEAKIIDQNLPHVEGAPFAYTEGFKGKKCIIQESSHDVYDTFVGWVDDKE